MGAVTRRKSKKAIATKGEKKLLDLFEQLTSEQQDKLIGFAEFLTGSPPAQSIAAEPLSIPRPAAETVTMAVRRLARTYPMLERRNLMGEASQLLAQHALHGRPSAAVIDDLEALFAKHYGKHEAEGAGHRAWKARAGHRKAKG